MRQDFRPTLVLSLVAFFVMMGVSIISPVLPAYALSFGVSLALVGLLISAFAVARVLLDIPAGMFSARFGMRRFMLIGLAIIAGSSIAAGLAPDYFTLLIARILEGVGSAMYTTVSITMVAKLAPRQSRGTHLSFYLSMFLLGTALGPAIGGTMSYYFGLNAPFLVYGLCAAASFILVYFLISEVRAAPGETERITLRQLARLVTSYDIISINLGTIAVFIVRQGILNTIVPIYALYNLDVGAELLGIILTLSAAANLATMVIAGRLTDLYGRKPFMIVSLLLLATLVAMLPFVGDVIGLTLVLLAMGLSIGLTGPIAAWVSDVTPPKEIGAAMGLFRTMGDIGFVVAPVTLAALAGEAGGKVGLLPFMVASLVIIIFSIPLLRTKDPIGEERAAAAQRLR
ncbi:MAG: MFS transporter [Candidatus Saccharibacteria bacterium]